MGRPFRILAYLWASPVTATGLAIAVAVRASQGKIQIRDGVIECSGGLAKRLLSGGRFRRGGAAVTLGHVIIARDLNCLAASREHERRHVRQYERWGPLLLPVAWGIAGWLKIKGFDPYLDHPFEQIDT
ncbi:hypothetical protein Pan44_18730 [Caulifigura coniformis]|uniref:Signal peptide prediction n=1 Tax=Caulifigura coniformis TaxID=2527983 RepID=A0A517SCJ7_9PLAN|nr:hypothetical protein [Caulifigura coniformis]QDT53849.1 hypothetical protein Pan44_18730 [Caulifigura coniformis]